MLPPHELHPLSTTVPHEPQLGAGALHVLHEPQLGAGAEHEPQLGAGSLHVSQLGAGVQQLGLQETCFTRTGLQCVWQRVGLQQRLRPASAAVLVSISAANANKILKCRIILSLVNQPNAAQYLCTAPHNSPEDTRLGCGSLSSHDNNLSCLTGICQTTCPFFHR